MCVFCLFISLRSRQFAFLAVLSLPTCLIIGSGLCLQSDTRTMTDSSTHAPINAALNAHLQKDAWMNESTQITSGIFDLENE